MVHSYILTSFVYIYIDGVSKLKLIFGPLNIYKLKMFSKSCNLVFFLFFYLGKILQIFLVVFFLRINVKSSSFSNVFMEFIQTWDVWVWFLLSMNFKVSVLELFPSRSLCKPLMRSLTTRTFKFLQTRFRMNQSPIRLNQEKEVVSRMASTSPLLTDFPP